MLGSDETMIANADEDKPNMHEMESCRSTSQVYAIHLLQAQPRMVILCGYLTIACYNSGLPIY